MKKISVIWTLFLVTLLAGCATTTYSTTPTNWTTTGENTTMMPKIDSEESFIVNMIPHHQEAVDSATIVLAKSTSPEVRQLAQNIITAQTKEIAQMEWRMKTWYPKSTMTSNYMKMMPDMTNLTGTAVDRAFLQWMIMHHQGAITMAHDVLTVPHREEITTLANNILTTQTQEISTMQNMLQEMH